GRSRCQGAPAHQPGGDRMDRARGRVGEPGCRRTSGRQYAHLASRAMAIEQSHADRDLPRTVLHHDADVVLPHLVPDLSQSVSALVDCGGRLSGRSSSAMRLRRGYSWRRGIRSAAHGRPFSHLCAQGPDCGRHAPCHDDDCLQLREQQSGRDAPDVAGILRQGVRRAGMDGHLRYISQEPRGREWRAVQPDWQPGRHHHADYHRSDHRAYRDVPLCAFVRSGDCNVGYRCLSAYRRRNPASRVSSRSNRREQCMIASSSGADTPRATNMRVIPVAGLDSMLLNLSGAHSPYFTRNLVLIDDDSGHCGAGEVPGGEGIRTVLEKSRPLVVGSLLGDREGLLASVLKHFGGLDVLGRGVQTYDQRIAIHVVTAIESCFLDLLGQHLGVPVYSLLGNGQQRKPVDVLGYLFFIGDRKRTPLPYRAEPDAPDPWLRLRNEEALTIPSILRLAEAAQERYGFFNFKLKGGVFHGKFEMEAVAALAEHFPGARVAIDPNGAWSLAEAIQLCCGKNSVLA